MELMRRTAPYALRIPPLPDACLRFRQLPNSNFRSKTTYPMEFAQTFQPPQLNARLKLLEANDALRRLAILANTVLLRSRVNQHSVPRRTAPPWLHLFSTGSGRGRRLGACPARF